MKKNITLRMALVTCILFAAGNFRTTFVDGRDGQRYAFMKFGEAVPRGDVVFS